MCTGSHFAATRPVVLVIHKIISRINLPGKSDSAARTFASNGKRKHQYIFKRSDVNIYALNQALILAKNFRERSMLCKQLHHRQADLLLSLLHACKILINAVFVLLFISHAAFAEIKDDKANRIVSGIISFTHWPELTRAPQLCVFSSAQHLSLLPKAAPAATPFSVVYLTNESELALQHCDAVYFGDQSPQQQLELAKQFQGKAVLTLAENNADCTVGAAFCLIFNTDHTLFSVNLDSLARSGVKVSPDVLLLSRNGSK
ncbi:YfiR family protein [Pantoea sp. USHLN256]|uniref:YfiR family protein n=1 Tax=Pantoea sp. USHLN256 TaxID=3081293 RepID=UPI0030174A83